MASNEHEIHEEGGGRFDTNPDYNLIYFAEQDLIWRSKLRRN